MSQGRPPPEGLVVFVALVGLFVALFLLGAVVSTVSPVGESVETATAPHGPTLRGAVALENF